MGAGTQKEGPRDEPKERGRQRESMPSVAPIDPIRSTAPPAGEVLLGSGAGRETRRVTPKFCGLLVVFLAMDCRRRAGLRMVWVCVCARVRVCVCLCRSAPHSIPSSTVAAAPCCMEHRSQSVESGCAMVRGKTPRYARQVWEAISRRRVAIPVRRNGAAAGSRGLPDARRQARRDAATDRCGPPSARAVVQVHTLHTVSSLYAGCACRLRMPVVLGWPWIFADRRLHAWPASSPRFSLSLPAVSSPTPTPCFAHPRRRRRPLARRESAVREC